MIHRAPAARPPSRQILSGNLIFERARAGLSQAGLAEASGVSRQNISDIERGVVNPSLDILDRLAGALGIFIDQLFIYREPGTVDDDELQRRRAAGRDDSVDALEFLDAVEESAGRPRRFSNAGCPRMGR